MSDNNPSYGFGKFVPGFDFLQNVAKGASQALPQMPSLSNWVAPTLSVEELEKRIGELRAVHFWLDQNSKALAATIQALEVQKMTLATLKGMNFNMSEMAEALKLKPTGEAADAQKSATGAPKESAHAGKGKSPAPGASGNGIVDPLQWWSALTQQFQQIAADAMKDAASHSAPDAATGAARTPARAESPEPSSSRAKPARKATAKSPARKAARKSATR